MRSSPWEKTSTYKVHYIEICCVSRSTSILCSFLRHTTRKTGSIIAHHSIRWSNLRESQTSRFDPIIYLSVHHKLSNYRHHCCPSSKNIHPYTNRPSHYFIIILYSSLFILYFILHSYCILFSYHFRFHRLRRSNCLVDQGSDQTDQKIPSTFR